MSYKIPTRLFRALAEAALPLRKQPFSRAALSWAALSRPNLRRAATASALLFALAVQAGAAAAAAKGPIGDALRRNAQQALADYASAHGWQDMEAKYEVWVPEGAARLPACPRALQVQPAQNDKLPWGRLSYLVSCPGPNSWSVRGRVEVKLWLTLWTARADLPPKHELSADDLIGRRLEVTRLRDFTVHQEEILGQRTQRRIRAGQPLLASTLLPQLVVRRGEQVVIQAEKDGIVASGKGEALENGSVGEAIKVRNLSSGAEIQAWVEGPGVVKTRF